MPMRTLLAVDDDKLWLATLRKWFTLAGYNIHTAVSCAEALKMAATLRPACVLLDYSLGDGTGAEVCSFIRNSEKLRKTPIIVISGCEEEELASHNQYQADAFILKPAQLAKVQAVMESTLRRVRIERGIVGKGDVRLETVNFQVYRAAELVTRLPEDQFRFFAMLIEKSPDFVSEADIAKALFNSDFAPDKSDAIRGLAQRLRNKLGPQLGRRVKSATDKGWIYVQPRVRP